MRAIAVNRARVPRGHGTRDEVERWFDRIPVERLGLGEREIFYVPRLHLRLRGPPGAHGERIPDMLLAQLRALLANAERSGERRFAPGRAYVFESRGRYHGWLVRLWIGETSSEARAAFRAATGHASLANWQRAALLREGSELVAAIARLAEEGLAARWIAHFEAADYALAERALQVAFGVALAGSAARPTRVASPVSVIDQTALFPEPIEEAAQALSARRNDWTALPPRGRALLIAAVLIVRTPGRQPSEAARLGAEVAAFAAQAGGLAAQAGSPTPPSAPVSPRSPAVMQPQRPAPAPPVLPDVEDRPQCRPGPSVEAPRPALRASAAAAPSKPAEVLGFFEPRHEARTPESFAPTARAAERHQPSPLPFIAPETGFETDFGGLLFLVNAFVAMGLYPDFTQPLGRRLEPSPLWLADRIGRCFFGGRYRRDPLSRWTAAHAAPGRLPRRWQAREEWLSGFPPARHPRLSKRGGRATLWHPAGFPLLDVPAHRAPRGAVHALPPARLPLGPDRWAACLALYLDARLRLITPAGLSLLELPATVRLSDLDILARFRLDSHPIALRMAGLDRDPGWQPAEGRSFAFAFL